MKVTNPEVLGMSADTQGAYLLHRREEFVSRVLLDVFFSTVGLLKV